MKRIFSIFLLAFVAVAGYAQETVIDVDIMQKVAGEYVYAEFDMVYSVITYERALKISNEYNNENNAQVFKGEYKTIEQLAGKNLLDKVPFANQTVQLRSYLDGGLIIEYDGKAIPVKCQGNIIRKESNYYLRYEMAGAVFKNENSVFSERKKGKFDVEIKKVTITGGKSALRLREGTTRSCGHTFSFSCPVWLSEDYTRSDARVVVVPYMIDPVTKDTVLTFNPVVVDGEDYHKTMHRKMGYQKATDFATATTRQAYSMLPEKHDKLHNYLTYLPEGFMRPHKRIELKVSGHVYSDSIDFDEVHYPVQGHITFEDYNCIYYTEDQQLSDGNGKNAKRYLDVEKALTDMPMDSTRYRVRVITNKEVVSDDYKMLFEVGKPNLMNDSLTQSEMSRVVNTFNSFKGSPGTEGSYLTNLSIHIYTTPEGSLRRNEELKESRPIAIREILKQRVNPGVYMPQIRTAGQIIPWSVVADTLEAREGAKWHEMAAGIRSVLRNNKFADSQWHAIAKKSWWPELRDYVLPNMRRVEISFESVQDRSIPAEETYEKYMAGAEGYKDCSAMRGYQFYDLMNTLYAKRDWKNLEFVARKAMTKVSKERVRRTMRVPLKDKDGNDMIDERTGNYVYSDTLRLSKKDEFRPYPLAAYYLMACLNHDDRTDFSLLYNDGKEHSTLDLDHLSYMDFSYGGGSEHPIRMNQRQGMDRKKLEWWNDEAIVINTVIMFIKKKDYNSAMNIALNFLPNDDRLTTFKLMLRALNCEFDDPVVRDSLAKTSPMNAVAVYLAQDTKEYYVKADSLLNIPGLFDETDFRVPYLRAICRFHLECNDCDLQGVKHYASECLYNPDGEGPDYGDWARPMIRAFEANEKNVDYIKYDGFFNSAYRHLVLYVWKRMKDGLTLDEACSEYDNMWSKYGAE